jgi:nitrogen fixation protein NifZ
VNAYDVGDLVTSTKALRNDGTYPEPGIEVGQVLVPEGCNGEVLNVGVYLQEHVIYAVAFENGRIVGCMERELEPTASVFEGVESL